jgi:hypothetical protein
MESLVSDIMAVDGNIEKHFLRCKRVKLFNPTLSVPVQEYPFPTPRCDKDDHGERLAVSLETTTGTTMTRNFYLKIYPKLFSLSTQTALVQ